MQLSDIFLGLGEATFQDLMRSVSMGKLKRFKLYDRVKTRLYLNKLNSETLRKAAPRIWTRMGERDDEFASDMAQAILISHLDMIRAVLDHQGIPHEDGFFAKEIDATPYLTDGWQERVIEKFKGVYPDALVRFYTAHLAWELLPKKGSTPICNASTFSRTSLANASSSSLALLALTIVSPTPIVSAAPCISFI